MRTKSALESRLAYLREMKDSCDPYTPQMRTLKGEIAALEWALEERDRGRRGE
ncbi:hypothetical protein ACFO0N_22030 [Halobium salinum]|uniref:Uncharacterized protein n=1 Tax=Halobium salinum TaxID=1364940 RepID=A0ABD5PIJ9_9EURY|nr:hypothetical protein [Halobium salinum]